MAAAKKKPKPKAKRAAPRKRKRKQPGPPPHEPTPQQRNQVEMLCAYGIKHDDVAALIGISDVTMRKHYRTEIDLGMAKVTAQVANAMVQRAVDKDHPKSFESGKFYLERRAPGWSEKHKHEITPTLPDGATPGAGMKFTLEFVDPVTNGAGDKTPSR